MHDSCVILLGLAMMTWTVKGHRSRSASSGTLSVREPSSPYSSHVDSPDDPSEGSASDSLRERLFLFGTLCEVVVTELKTTPALVAVGTFAESQSRLELAQQWFEAAMNAPHRLADSARMKALPVVSQRQLSDALQTAELTVQPLLQRLQDKGSWPVSMALVESGVSTVADLVSMLVELGWIDSPTFESRVRRLATRLASSELRESVDKIKQTEHEVAEAAGSVGSNSLALAFTRYSDQQRSSARLWMTFSVAGLLAVAVIGGLMLRPDLSWQQMIAHLVIALPLAGVAAYAARESSRHRETSQWASRLAAQLLSLGPFSERLSEAGREKLWDSFGSYVFGPYAGATENQLHTVPPELVRAMTDLVKVGRGGG